MLTRRNFFSRLTGIVAGSAIVSYFLKDGVTPKLGQFVPGVVPEVYDNKSSIEDRWQPLTNDDDVCCFPVRPKGPKIWIRELPSLRRVHYIDLSNDPRGSEEFINNIRAKLKARKC